LYGYYIIMIAAKITNNPIVIFPATLGEVLVLIPPLAGEFGEAGRAEPAEPEETVLTEPPLAAT
jgi:hypothetical protein